VSESKAQKKGLHGFVLWWEGLKGSQGGRTIGSKRTVAGEIRKPSQGSSGPPGRGTSSEGKKKKVPSDAIRQSKAAKMKSPMWGRLFNSTQVKGKRRGRAKERRSRAKKGGTTEFRAEPQGDGARLEKVPPGQSRGKNWGIDH